MADVRSCDLCQAHDERTPAPDDGDKPQRPLTAQGKVARPGATASARRVGALPSAHTVAEDREPYPGQTPASATAPSSSAAPRGKRVRQHHDRR